MNKNILWLTSLLMLVGLTSRSQIRKEIEMSDLNIGDIHLSFDLILGTGPASENIFKYPYSLAVDQEGRIYVSDRGNKRIQIFSRDGKFLNTIGGAHNRVVKLVYPKAIAIDPDGRLFIGDSSMGREWLTSLKKDLTFDKKIEVPYGAAQIGFYDGNIVFLTKDRVSTANIFIVDHDGKTASILDKVPKNTILAASRVNADIEASSGIYLAHEFTRRVREISFTGETLLEFTYLPLTKNYKPPQTGIMGDTIYYGTEQPICYDVATDKAGNIYLLVSTDYLVNEKCALCQFDVAGRLIDSIEVPFLCSRLLLDDVGNFYFLSQMETGLLYRYRMSKRKDES